MSAGVTKSAIACNKHGAFMVSLDGSLNSYVGAPSHPGVTVVKAEAGVVV